MTLSYADAMKKDASSLTRGSKRGMNTMKPSGDFPASSKISNDGNVDAAHTRSSKKKDGTSKGPWGGRVPMQTHQTTQKNSATRGARHSQGHPQLPALRADVERTRPPKKDTSWRSIVSPASNNTPGSVTLLKKEQINHPFSEPERERTKNTHHLSNVVTSKPDKSKKQATASNPGKKTSKPKPKLKLMSIGDMMAEPKTGRQGRKGTTQTSLVATARPMPEPLKVDSRMEFPSLGSNTSLIAKPRKPQAWGTKSPLVTKSLDGIKGEKEVARQTQSRSLSKTKKKASEKHLLRKEAKKVPQKRNDSIVADNKMSAAMFFKPTATRTEDGAEHQLFRLMQDRNVYQKKGRQRVAPRKKKFTALKKKVLQERLRNWKELHPDEATSTGALGTRKNSLESGIAKESCSVCIYQFVTKEETEDDDEYDELIENLRDMASKVGDIDTVFIPRNLDRVDRYPAFIRFKVAADAAAAKACWDGLIVGGEQLEAMLVDKPQMQQDLDKEEWAVKILEAEENLGSAITDIEETKPEQTTIILTDILTEDDYEDNECMNESLDDLGRVARKLGKVLDIRPCMGNDGNLEVVYEANETSALSLISKLNETKVSGKILSAVLADELPRMPLSSSLPTSCVLIENIITEDDLEDNDCLAETLNDIRELAAKFGPIVNIKASGVFVYIYFSGDQSVAQNAVNGLDGLCLGGITVSAKISDETFTHVYLGNILSEDDMEDDECLEESLNDIRKMVLTTSKMKGIDVVEINGCKTVRLSYNSLEDAKRVVAEMDGKLVAGQAISAVVGLREGSTADDRFEERPSGAILEDCGGEKRKTSDENKDTAVKKARTDTIAPLYSGDKLIPERFAECKRVPKVPNTPGPREYAKLVDDERVKPLLIEMLGELMRLQKRAMEDKNAKARRRVVLGLREVARGIRAHKVKMVVMANNLDQYGAIDEKLQEIIDLSYSEGVPLFYEFTKRTLGKAVGKSIKVAVVGIQNADGAYQPFKKLTAIAAKMF